MSFNTAVIFEKRLLSTRRAIAGHYATTQLRMDISLCIIDWAVLIASVTGTGGSEQTLQSFRLFKLFRVFQINRIIKFMSSKVRTALSVTTASLGLYVLETVCMMTIGIHVLECLWYSIGAAERGWVSADSSGFYWCLSNGNCGVETLQRKLWS